MMNSASLNHRRHENQPQVEEYSPKPSKPWLWSRAVEYVFREQRYLFILLGMALASAVFMYGSFMRSSEDRVHIAKLEPEVFPSYGRRAAEREYINGHLGVISPGGKIPLGMKRKAQRIVVTGGAGFVGSHLVDRLMERGDNVIVVDNFFTGRKENVMHHFGNPRFELIRHDVVEPLLLEVDQIYHLACPASPVHYKFNPVKTIISLICKLVSVRCFSRELEGSGVAFVIASLHLFCSAVRDIVIAVVHLPSGVACSLTISGTRQML